MPNMSLIVYISSEKDEILEWGEPSIREKALLESIFVDIIWQNFVLATNICIDEYFSPLKLSIVKLLPIRWQ